MSRAAILAAALLAAGPGIACAPVPPKGATVHIEKEEAIIIWDQAAKMQHFIRRASFDTKAKDFGFLVPTPTQPALAEADDEVFKHLAAITAPKVVKPPPDAKLPLYAPAGRPSVKVLARATVAGLDAVVLEANNAEALNGWLKEHGYPSSPDLVAWFKPYIEKRWKITAFKIAKRAPDAQRVSAAAVRMSFKTDRPFFPYREPRSQLELDRRAAEPRILRVYLVADARYAGSVDVPGGWPAHTLWSNRVEGAARGRLLELAKLPATTAPGADWLTEFEQVGIRSGDDEIWFGRSADQASVKRRDIVAW